MSDSPDREERLDDEELTALRAAIGEGDASGLGEDDVFDRIRDELGLTKGAKIGPGCGNTVERY